MNKISESRIAYCVATPEGRGAVATIIVNGPHAVDRIAGLFRSARNRPITSYAWRQIVYGHWLNENQDGEDLVICCNSEDHLEIHCHGGLAAVEMITGSLQREGFPSIGQDEMASRMHGHPYWAQLKMVVTRAPTTKTALWLLRQTELHRQFWKEVTLALYKCDRDALEKIARDFLHWQTFGFHLTRPWSIVFCGAPNVGKSSLINAILGYQRAIVHETAGTTRDVVSAHTAIDGWPVEMRDTAGLRITDNQIEQLGIEQTRSSICDADVVVQVFDASNEIENAAPHQIERGAGIHCVVANKVDLTSPASAKDFDFQLSAKSGLNLEPFIEHLAQLLVPQTPPPNQAVPVCRLQTQAIHNILNLAYARDWKTSHSVANSILSGVQPEALSF